MHNIVFDAPFMDEDKVKYGSFETHSLLTIPLPFLYTLSDWSE